MKTFIVKILPLLDLILVPFVYPAAWLLKNVRRAGVMNLPHCKAALLRVGVFPIRNHYYEPRFDYRDSANQPPRERDLPAIDWNEASQLAVLSTLTFKEELSGIPANKTAELEFYMNNGSFQQGDAEFWYQLIRAVKPRRIFEVGSGYSTQLAIMAVNRNRELEPAYKCRHLCIEPYENPWLEKAGVEVVRKKVEDLGASFFSELEANDILFIDSSHVIRPGGDVLFEYLELLPMLKKGVIVHAHDIFSPRNYPPSWFEGEVRFWNEQYLLEAFLANNREWEIIGALNYLYHRHYQELRSVAPYLAPEREPRSFYIRRIGPSGPTAG